VTNHTKKELRERILQLLKDQKEEDQRRKSLSILQKLFRMQEFESATTILFYASFGGEVDTFEMIKQAQKLGKKIGLPRIHKNDKHLVPVLVNDLDKDLVMGSYGILEPNSKVKEQLDLGAIDLVIVPAVAFDKKNNRLGRGGGYYDRFLRHLPSSVSTVGLAFDFQIFDHFPFKEDHDIAVKHVMVN
jgi:5-formyltetrahydrofolate cyclo-ligase